MKTPTPAREWVDYPQGIVIETKLGKLVLAVTERAHIYAETEKKSDVGLTVRGVSHRASFHFFAFDGGWNLDQGRARSYFSRLGSGALDATESAKKVMNEAALAAVCEWAANAPGGTFDMAQAAHVNNRLMVLEGDVVEHEKKIAKLREEIAALNATLPVSLQQVKA